MRTTMQHLENRCELLNKLAGTPETRYIRVNGRNVAQLNNYHIGGSYGMYELCQMVNETGGIRQVTGLGTAREINTALSALINTLYAKGE